MTEAYECNIFSLESNNSTPLLNSTTKKKKKEDTEKESTIPQIIKKCPRLGVKNLPNTCFKTLDLKLTRENLFSSKELPDYFRNFGKLLESEEKKEKKEEKEEEHANNKESEKSSEKKSNSQLGEESENRNSWHCFKNDDNQAIREAIFKDRKKMYDYVKNHVYACHVQLLLCYKLSVISFTQELTKECGNLWSNNLVRATSNSIEYIIMHSLYNNEFIIAQKKSRKRKNDEDNAAPVVNEIDEEKEITSDFEDNDNNNNNSNDIHDNNENGIQNLFEDKEELGDLKTTIFSKKGAVVVGGGGGGSLKSGHNYQGGKILDIKKQEYDNGLIFLIDISSMYGSMIQKYNICITNPLNVTLSDARDELSIIPKLIYDLVEKRRRIQTSIVSLVNTNFYLQSK